MYQDHIPLNQETVSLPFRLTPHLRRLFARLEGRDGAEQALTALKAQFIPSAHEHHIQAVELDDPLGAAQYTAAPRLVHQYRNRCLMLTAGRCFAYCRYCFRRRYMEKEEGGISDSELDAVCAYLKAHPEVQEILCSGGDPLILDDSRLETIFGRLREARPGILIRICTRSPLFAPERFTPDLISLFRRFRPLWLIPHINHPIEIHTAISPETEQALVSCIDAGIAVQSQTVLLRGVNDSAEILADLFHRLVCLGVKPGYLFQTDLAPGTSHLRVRLERGLTLYKELRQRLSGLSCPVYAVDLPGGGGKFNLIQLEEGDMDISHEGESYRFRKNGNEWIYYDVAE